MYNYACRTGLSMESELESGLGGITHQQQPWHQALHLFSFPMGGACTDVIHGQTVVGPASLLQK